MHIQKAEDFRLGIAEGVEDGAGFEAAVFRQIDHHLHADGPLVLVMAGGQAEVFVELAADGADRPVADDGEGGADVHAGHETASGLPSRRRPGRAGGPR